MTRRSIVAAIAFAAAASSSDVLAQVEIQLSGSKQAIGAFVSCYAARYFEVKESPCYDKDSMLAKAGCTSPPGMDKDKDKDKEPAAVFQFVCQDPKPGMREAGILYSLIQKAQFDPTLTIKSTLAVTCKCQ